MYQAFIFQIYFETVSTIAIDSISFDKAKCLMIPIMQLGKVIALLQFMKFETRMPRNSCFWICIHKVKANVPFLTREIL